MRRTKEEALITRGNLLTSALQVFSRSGYSATRLEDIAQVANVTRGAIYHHFGSKEELYIALVTERSSGINQLAEEIVSGGGPPRAILRSLLVRLFEFVEEDDEYRAFLELAANKVELTEGLKSIMHGTVEGRRQLATYFQEILRQGIQAGEFRSDLPIEAAAYAAVGFLNGVGLIWIQDQDSYTLRKNAGELVDVFLKGLDA